MLCFRKKFTLTANQPTKTLRPPRRKWEKAFVAGHLCSPLRAKEGIKVGSKECTTPCNGETELMNRHEKCTRANIYKHLWNDLKKILSHKEYQCLLLTHKDLWAKKHLCWAPSPLWHEGTDPIPRVPGWTQGQPATVPTRPERQPNTTQLEIKNICVKSNKSATWKLKTSTGLNSWSKEKINTITVSGQLGQWAPSLVERG